MENTFINILLEENGYCPYECEKIINDSDDVYDELHKYILELPKNKRPITFSSDYAISTATTTAIGEKYMMDVVENNVTKYVTPVKFIYITPTCHMNDFEEVTHETLTDAILANIIGTIEQYTTHKFLISRENFMLVGLKNKDCAIEHNLKHITMDQIKTDIENLTIDEFIDNDNVFVIFDMSVMSVVFAPNVTRYIKNIDNIENQFDGLYNDELIGVFKQISKYNIVGIDITGYNIDENSNKEYVNLTKQCALLPLKYLLGIDIGDDEDYTTDTFLICRSVIKKSETDYEWDILKNISKDMERELKKELTDDKFLIYGTNDDSQIYVSLTTIQEQEFKSNAKSIYDFVLCEIDKNDMYTHVIRNRIMNKN